MATLMLKLPDLLQNGHTNIKMDTLMLKWQHLHWKWTHLRNPSTSYEKKQNVRKKKA